MAKKNNTPRDYDVSRGLVEVPIKLLFTLEDFQLLFELANERGFVFPVVYGKPPKNKDDLDQGAVKDSINNLVRDYLDKKKGIT